MKMILFLFAIFSSSAIAISVPQSDLVDIFKTSSRVLHVAEDNLINIQLNDESMKISFYSKREQKVQIVERDLGVARINEYIIREVKNRNPKVILSPNPMSLSEVQHAFKFISNQLFNMIPFELRELFRSREVKIHFVDEGMTKRLNDFVSLPHVDMMSDQLLISSIYNCLGQTDSDLSGKGFIQPEKDVTRMVLAYTILNHFGVYTASNKQVD